MKEFCKRFVSFCLVIAVISSTVVVPTRAASPGLGRDDPTKFYSYITNNDAALLGFFKANMLENVFGPGGVGQQSSEDALQDIADYFNAEGNNGFVAQIKAKAAQLYDGGTLQTFYSWLAGHAPYAVVEYDRANKIMRLKDKRSNRWIVNGAGEYPYYVPTGDIPAKDYDISAMAASGSWVDSRSISAVTQISLISEDALANLAVMLNKNGFNTSLSLVNMNGTQYKAIRHNDGNYGKWFSTRQGAVYVTSYEPSAVNQQWNYNVGDVTQNSNNQTATSVEGAAIVGDGNKLIDLGSGKFLSPEFTLDGDINFVDQSVGEVIYDFTDNSYHLTTYDYTYNVTNNYYEYNYYTYNVQYTYNNTYVTYVGSTAEFVPTTYELYYELPDGRSSADLTAEDIAGLSFQFHDVINYTRGVTDESLLALYHFDGDTDDASFYNKEDSFVWNSGASITYMESNAFEGALYLDEQPHEFTLTLPKALGTGNFTLQWRYYQNAAVDQGVHNDNYITSNGVKLFGWSEQYMYALGTTQLTTGLSVGTWQELALIRVGSTLYFYHNGLMVGSASLSSVLGNTITFHFGDGSKAYGMLDELRVLDFAYVTEGKRYSPSVVPFDTNQVLVLPQAQNHIVIEEIPGTDDVVIHHKELVDQYWEFTYDTNPTLKFDFSGLSGNTYKPTFYSYTNFPFGALSGYCIVFNASGVSKSLDIGYGYSFGTNEKAMQTSTIALNKWLYGASPSYLFSDGVFTPSLATWKYNDASGWGYPFFATYTDLDDITSYFLNVPSYSAAEDKPCFYINYSSKSGSLLSGVYTAFVVFEDGTSASGSFTAPTIPEKFRTSFATSSVSLASASSSVVLTSFISGASSYSYRTLQGLSLQGSSGIRYLEITPGSTPNPHQYVYDYYEWDEVIPGTEYVPGQDYYENLIEPNTAAIQTDIPVKGYTVGGVRPTFPQRGDVWMPVEGSRIAGVQVYNGRAWEETNARWWTGSRWIPIYAFDIYTLADLWDVGTQDGSDIIPPITSESGFWRWWQTQWLDFRAWLEKTWTPGSGPGSSPGTGLWDTIKNAFSNVLGEIVESIFTFITEVLKLVLDLVLDLLKFFFDFLTSTVIEGIGNLFSAFTDGSLFEGFRHEGEDGSTTFALPEGVATVFAVFSGIIMLLPAELRSVLIFGIAALVLISLLKMVKA